MLYRDSYGRLCEVRRDMYSTDLEYYKKIYSLKSGVSKVCDEKARILNIVVKKPQSH